MQNLGELWTNQSWVFCERLWATEQSSHWNDLNSLYSGMIWTWCLYMVISWKVNIGWPEQFLPVSSSSTEGTCSSNSLRSSSLRATLRSSRGQASSSDVVFSNTKPRDARPGDWINWRKNLKVSYIHSSYIYASSHHNTLTFGYWADLFTQATSDTSHQRSGTRRL